MYEMECEVAVARVISVVITAADTDFQPKWNYRSLDHLAANTNRCFCCAVVTVYRLLATLYPEVVIRFPNG